MPATTRNTHDQGLCAGGGGFAPACVAAAPTCVVALAAAVVGAMPPATADGAAVGDGATGPEPAIGVVPATGPDAATGGDAAGVPAAVAAMVNVAV